MATKQTRKAKKARKAQKARRAKISSSMPDAEALPAAAETTPFTLLNTISCKILEGFVSTFLQLTALICALGGGFVHRLRSPAPETIKPASEKPKQFLDLPAEIRLEVYEWYFAFIPFESVKGNDSADRPPTRVAPMESFRPALLHVNHQICQEALKPYLSRLGAARNTLETRIQECFEKVKKTDHGGTIEGEKAQLAAMRALDRPARLAELLTQEIQEATVMLKYGVVGTGRIPSHNPMIVKAAFREFKTFMAQWGEDGYEKGWIYAFAKKRDLSITDVAELLTMALDGLLSPE